MGVFCHEASQILTRLPSKVVSSPSLEILRTWLDMTLSNLLCLDLLWEGNWNTWSAFLLKVVHDSTVSWLYRWGVEWSHQNSFKAIIQNPEISVLVTGPLSWIMKWSLLNAGYYSQYTQFNWAYTDRYLLFSYYATKNMCWIERVVWDRDDLSETPLLLNYWSYASWHCQLSTWCFYSSSQVSCVRSLPLFLRH